MISSHCLFTFGWNWLAKLEWYGTDLKLSPPASLMMSARQDCLKVQMSFISVWG